MSCDQVTVYANLKRQEKISYAEKVHAEFNTEQAEGSVQVSYFILRDLPLDLCIEKGGHT